MIFPVYSTINATIPLTIQLPLFYQRQIYVKFLHLVTKSMYINTSFTFDDLYCMIKFNFKISVNFSLILNGKTLTRKNYSIPTITTTQLFINIRLAMNGGSSIKRTQRSKLPLISTLHLPHADSINNDPHYSPGPSSESDLSSSLEYSTNALIPSQISSSTEIKRHIYLDSSLIIDHSEEDYSYNEIFSSQSSVVIQNDFHDLPSNPGHEEIRQSCHVIQHVPLLLYIHSIMIFIKVSLNDIFISNVKATIAELMKIDLPSKYCMRINNCCLFTL